MIDWVWAKWRYIARYGQAVKLSGPWHPHTSSYCISDIGICSLVRSGAVCKTNHCAIHVCSSDLWYTLRKTCVLECLYKLKSIKCFVCNVGMKKDAKFQKGSGTLSVNQARAPPHPHPQIKCQKLNGSGLSFNEVNSIDFIVCFIITFFCERVYRQDVMSLYDYSTTVYAQPAKWNFQHCKFKFRYLIC